MRPDDLDRELSAAGDRARRSFGHEAVPDRAFADTLREQLLSGLPSRDAAFPRERERARGLRRPWFVLPRQLRLVPLALAAVLAIATVAGARELYVALVADDPDPTPTPTAVESLEPTPSASLEPTWEPTWEPTVEPTESPDPTAAPSVSPAPTPEPTAVPTPRPTAKPTAKPTPKPEPDPTPQPVSPMSLSAMGCHGGVVLGWSIYGGDGFNHYTTLRNTAANIPMAYPPQGGAVDFGETYTTHLEKTSAIDVSGTAGVTYYYRTMAFNGENQVIGATPIVSAVPKPVKALGVLNAEPDAGSGGTRLSWTPYTGSASCFTYYKIVYSETNDQPSYGTDPYLAALSSQEASEYVAPDGFESLQSGHTYFIRVQAIRATHLGWFVSAQTNVATYTVP